MGYFGALALLAGAHALGVMSPGPNFLFVSSTAMHQSRRAGVAAGLGVAAGSITWSALTLSGLGVLVSRLPELYDILRLLAAAYLVWIGWKMVWRAGATMPVTVTPSADAWVSARKAWLVNMTNPKSLAYYASVFAALVPVHAPFWVYAAAMGITSLISCTWYCVVAWLLSGGTARRAFLNARSAMETVIGLFLVGLGIRIFATR